MFGPSDFKLSVGSSKKMRASWCPFLGVKISDDCECDGVLEHCHCENPSPRPIDTRNPFFCWSAEPRPSATRNPFLSVRLAEPQPSPRVYDPRNPFELLDTNDSLSPQEAAMLLNVRGPSYHFSTPVQPIFHISTKNFARVTLKLRKSDLDANKFNEAFKGLLSMRYFQWERKYWYFGADYSLIEEKDIGGVCKSVFDQYVSHFRPGVKYDKVLLEAISYKKIVYVDARQTLRPVWTYGDDGWCAEIPTMPKCTLHSMSVPQPSPQVLHCCDQMAGFLYSHMCAGDDVTFRVVVNFFLATVLGIKVDIMIFLYGPKGTGKSTFVNILRHLVGPHLFEQTSIDKFGNSGYVEGKSFIAIHEAEKPNAECVGNMKERVTDPLMSHNNVKFNCRANFVFCGNKNCDELIDDRRCFSIYLDKKPTPEQAIHIKAFLDLIETNPEVGSVFYDRLYSYAHDTIQDFVNGTQTWLRFNEIDQQRRGSCNFNAATCSLYNLFHVNNETDAAIRVLFEHICQNASPNSTKKIPLPTNSIDEKLNKEISTIVETLGISVTKVKGLDVVAPKELELALYRLAYPQMMNSNRILLKCVEKEKMAGAQSMDDHPFCGDSDDTTTYEDESSIKQEKTD